MLRSISICIFLIGVLLSCFTAAFITELSTKPWISKRSGSHTLFGVPEWKAKFSSSTNSTSLPLLMFPFEPTQIPLPGQHAKITFRHGKYMDMIDESLTSYESVVGMSVLYQDRLLPIVVVCEVIEEELDIKSGYRGFSSMEVGFRAIGRMEWVDTQSEQDASDVFHGRKPLTDIQLGQFIDYEDADLSDAGIDSCRQYLKNIESLLALPSNFLTRPRITKILMNSSSSIQMPIHTFHLKSEMFQQLVGHCLLSLMTIQKYHQSSFRLCRPQTQQSDCVLV